MGGWLRVFGGRGAWIIGVVAVFAVAPGAAWGSAPRNGLIAYSYVGEDASYCDGCGDRPPAFHRSWIETVRPNGEGRRRLPCTTGPFKTCHDGSPAFSPDGSRLAILNLEGIVIARPNGEVLRRLPIEALSVAWSPDGRRLAYTASYTVGPGPVLHAVYVTRLGGTSRQVPGAVNIDPWSLSWSARGLLAWEKSRRTGVERSRRTGVFVSDSRGGGRRRILSAPGPSRLPRWSYDGSKLSYVCRDVLCETRPDGSARRVLSPRCDMTEDLAGMAWSPDGRQIACVGRLGNLMTLRLDTGHRQILRRPTSRGVGYLPVEITWRPRPTH